MKQDMDTIKNIQLLLEQIPVVLEEIRRQNYTFALKRISAIVQSLACLLEALEEDLQEELKEILTRILQAQEQRDYILMADFYECLLKPFLEKLQETLLLSKEEEESTYKSQYIEGKKRLQKIDLELAVKLSELPEKNLWQQRGYEVERTSSGSYTVAVELEGYPYFFANKINPGWGGKQITAHLY